MVAGIAGIPPDVPSDRNLYLDLGVASVHAIRLLTALEELFGVPIPDDDFISATSISKLTHLVDGLLKDKPDGSPHV
jgi:acyl carrier protein